jgi:hypothetical protein
MGEERGVWNVWNIILSWEHLIDRILQLSVIDFPVSGDESRKIRGGSWEGTLLELLSEVNYGGEDFAASFAYALEVKGFPVIHLRISLIKLGSCLLTERQKSTTD